MDKFIIVSFIKMLYIIHIFILIYNYDMHILGNKEKLHLVDTINVCFHFYII